MSKQDTPAALGYRMAAEWEPHAATWLAWPHKLESWPGKFEPVPPIYVKLIETLSQHELVHVLAGGEKVMSEAKRFLKGKPVLVTPSLTEFESSPTFGTWEGETVALGQHRVVLHNIATNDAWTRDHGPTFLVGPIGAPPALVDWGYNAWGGKYPPFDLDDAVPKQIAQWSARRRFTPGIILEGGAIDSNGAGTILTTEQCLLNPNRNPHLKRADMERYLADYLGAKKVLWLGEGIEGDDTDGHIDELARFVGPRTVVCALEDDPADTNYKPLRDNYERLQKMTDQDGKPLEVVPLPMPRPIHHDGQRLPACYCNFYIANGVVVVPQFDDVADNRVLEILAKQFPTRKVVGLPARDLVWGLGAFHCITQQEPLPQMPAR
jgi:agmatine deiminase